MEVVGERMNIAEVTQMTKIELLKGEETNRKHSKEERSNGGQSNGEMNKRRTIAERTE
jgi:hypothetical protein